MGYSNGIVTAPVDTDDVKKALCVGSNDVGTLCTSANINEWSLVKPVIQGTPSYYPVALSGFGVIPVTAGKTDNYLFEYQRPYQNYRLLDFDGYNHNTLPPQLSPESVDFVAVTPDTFSGDNTVNLDLKNIRTLLTRIRNEQSGAHAINQFLLRGNGDVITTINYGSYTGETLHNVAVVNYNNTTIKLRNPGITTKARYTGMLRSSYSGTASVAGTVYQFKNAPLSFEFNGYLQGLLVTNIGTGQSFKGGCVLSCQSTDFHPNIGGGLTDLFADSDILLTWYTLSSDRSAYVNIVFTHQLDAALVAGLKSSLYMLNSIQTAYTCVLGTGYINASGDAVLQYNLNSDGTYAGSKCEVTYSSAYNGTDVVGLTDELAAWCKGKPLLRFRAKIANVDYVPTTNYPILMCKIAKQ